MFEAADDARAIGRRPDGSGHWFRFPEATRGLPNPAHALARALRLNEVHFNGATVDWVEVVNRLDAPVPTTDLFLASTRDFSDKEPLAGRRKGSAGEPAAAIPGKGFASCDVAFPVKNGEVRLYLVNSAGVVLDCGVFDPPKRGDTLQAFPDGGREWYAATPHSRSAANNPARHPRG